MGSYRRWLANEVDAIQFVDQLKQENYLALASEKKKDIDDGEVETTPETIPVMCSESAEVHTATSHDLERFDFFLSQSTRSSYLFLRIF